MSQRGLCRRVREPPVPVNTSAQRELVRLVKHGTRRALPRLGRSVEVRDWEPQGCLWLRRVSTVFTGRSLNSEVKDYLDLLFSYVCFLIVLP